MIRAGQNSQRMTKGHLAETARSVLRDVLRCSFGSICQLCDASRLLRPAVTLSVWLHRLAMKDDHGRLKATCLAWKNNYSAWSQRFRIGTTTSTWLTSSFRTGLGVGCKVCQAAKVNSPWARLEIRNHLQACKFADHQASEIHQAATAKYLNEQYAKPIDEFKVVIEKLREGATFASLGYPGTKMAWCVFEAIKARDREALRNAKFVAIMRDERAGRLLIRFRAVNDSLDMYSGTLGLQREFGTGAIAITNATEAIMRRMCTNMYKPMMAQDVCGDARLPRLDTELFEHLKAAVICIGIDSASDETLSAELMRSSLLSTGRVLTPNLKWVVKDKAHASRRIVSRPWAADEYVKDVSLMFAQGHGSMARLIQHSHDLRRVFQGYITNESAASAVVETACSNMRAAKHRFESFAKPLGRSCLHLHAVIKTAIYATTKSHQDSADRAKCWLRWVNTERCLMAAMLADAADQALALTRFMDQECVDPATVHAEIHSFDSRGLRHIRRLPCTAKE